jgi:amino acid transporter
MSEPRAASWAARAKAFLLGKARDIRDPSLFHNLSLVAFFAWVGLGADGLSSSCYGPEEAFLVLQRYPSLGLVVALATALTIFVITASYSQIVELFPSGGGGYLVASKLLSPAVGMVSGCALLIDYALTITLSIASGADALFSFLPPGWRPLRLAFAVAGVLVLIVLNLRGVRESVLPLIPIFLLFLATHIFAIFYALAGNAPAIGSLAGSLSTDAKSATAELGAFGMVVLILRSYGMGAGTYTGIEAVSNGLPVLREPKVRTAKTTMRYMAISLAVMAVGLMLGYLLYRVGPIAGKTLNAILFEKISAAWSPGLGRSFVLVTLVSEAVLLFVAAQTGFLDGPRVLANMSVDRWLPSQFSLLSERFVIKNGILLMGGAAIVLMIASRGSVTFLLTLYAINVFITFLLSQLGMVRHWWRERVRVAAWRRKLAVNGLGLLLTGFILAAVVVLKFRQGGWITLLITGSLVGIALLVKRFYKRTQRRLARLDALMATAADSGPLASDGHGARTRKAPAFQPDKRTAVILVSGFNGTGLHTLLNVRKLFGEMFANWFFLRVGVVDADRFKGAEEIEGLRAQVAGDLERYVRFMRGQGLYAEGFSAVGTDVAEEASALARSIFRKTPSAVFFGGRIVYPEESFFTRALSNATSFTIQRRLHHEGIPFIIMPVRVS